MPPYDIQERLGEWIERWENFKGFSKGSWDICEAKIENDLVRNLKKEIDKVFLVHSKKNFRLVSSKKWLLILHRSFLQIYQHRKPRKFSLNFLLKNNSI